MSDAIQIRSSDGKFKVPSRTHVEEVLRGGPWNDCRTFSGTLWHLLMKGFAFLICLTIPAVCSAQVVQLHTSDGKGTAVCVGTTESDGQLFVTVKHNFYDDNVRAKSIGSVLFKGQTYKVENLAVSDTEDLACFTSMAPTKPLPIFEGSLNQGAEVDVPGFGPLYHGRSNAILVRHGRIEDLELVVNSDSQVVPGDSGCPVVYQDRTVGIVRAFFNDSPRKTQIIPAVRVDRFLKRCQWQCTPNGCYIRQRVRQPIAGLVIPIGPPQIETQIIPRPAPRPQPIPDENFEGPKVVQGPRGERGPAGPAGKDGRDGADGSGPDPNQVEQIVISWLEQNRDQLKGDAGDTREIEKRLRALETRPLKVIITEAGKLKDEESYLPGEPVVFDLARLRAK